MLDEILSRLGGRVLVRAEGPYPERVLNRCGELELAFRDLRWESPGAVTFRLSRRDWRRLCREAETLECSLRVERREGLPYLVSRARPSLLVPLVLCGAALFLGSFFVWDYEIEGNETIPAERILRALEREGVGLGSFGLSLDGEDLRNHVLLDIPELQWLTVNVSGCRAKVQVRERVMPPEMADRATPSNVTARRDGLILEVHALDGKAAVKPGMSVTEGQLLISGTEELETVGRVRVMAGHGSVLARTWHTLTASVPLDAPAKAYTGRKKNVFSLILGKRRIKFFSNRAVTGLEEGEGYDKITKRVQWKPLGIPLPVTVTREQYRFYEEIPAARPAEETRRRMEAVLREQLAAEVAPYGEIRSALCTARQRGEILEVTLSAECVEEIGRRTPLYTD